MKTLVIFSKDWSDEFQVESFQIYDLSVEQTKQHIKETVVGFSLWFGTNEGWEEDEICLSDFEFKAISEEEASVIEKVIGKNFGTASF